jgi:signal transduction histidine kinase
MSEVINIFNRRRPKEIVGMKILDSGMAKRAFIVLTLVISAIYFVCAYFYISEKRQYLIQEKYFDLLKKASYLEREVHSDILSVKLNEIGLLEATGEEKAQMLSQYYQPIIDEVCHKYRGYGFGLYAKEIDRRIAIGPNFSYALLTRTTNPATLKIYETGEPQFTEIPVSHGWEGKSILSASYPIKSGGVIIGHTWASAKKEDVETEIRGAVLRLIGLFFLIWLIVVLLIACTYNKLQVTLLFLVKQIKFKNDDTSNFKAFPELLPVFETIVELREQLYQEYLEREKINTEMARISKLTVISEIAASVAHEVRNPMTVIKGYAQYMMHHADIKDKSKYEIMIEEIDRINSIVIDFLELARNKSIQKTEQNINDIIFGIYPQIQDEALNQDVSVELELEQEIPLVMLDETEMKQLILNLTHNAFDAMTGTKGQLTIRTARAASDVTISISDNGCGIPSKDLKRIFDPFYTTKDHGTGLGLAICTSIVDRHGGELTAESEVGRGTTFIVILPL